jgi:hypothetical protein
MVTPNDATMTKLYRGRNEYVAWMNKYIDQMVRAGWVLAQDADLIRPKP